MSTYGRPMFDLLRISNDNASCGSWYLVPESRPTADSPEVVRQKATRIFPRGALNVIEKLGS